MPRKRYCYDCRAMHRFDCVRGGSIRSVNRSFAVPVPPEKPSWWQRLKWWLKDWYTNIWWNH